MSEKPAKQQVIDKLKSSETVLVTVSSNPSVDELSAALGFTVLLNKLNKHATAVFSGDIPPAITFLDPEKTFENTVDSLRDFIIALDKEKADHLRYKVEGEMVKIFITPYQTTIDQKDFEFSQGDYNVEMVIAIGVQSEDDLDRALTGHGRILHDATVASLSVGEDRSDLGTIAWHDRESSSYSEMLFSVVESLKGSKNPIDEQIATAFLTGIVAATDRFSNPKTSSKAMTVAAQLMAAGANQQLIATKLEEAEEIGDQSPEVDPDPPDEDEAQDGGGPDKGEDDSVLKVERDEKSAKTKPKEQEPIEDEPAADGTMKISRTKRGSVDEVAEQVAREGQKKAVKHAEEQLASSLASAKPKANVPSVDDLKRDLEKASGEIDDAAEMSNLQSTEPILPSPIEVPTPDKEAVQGKKASKPRMGGTLNATSHQAAEDKRRELEDGRNRTILNHKGGDHLEATPQSDSQDETHSQTVNAAPTPAEPSQDDPNEPHEFTQRGKTIQPPSATDGPTLADLKTEKSGQDAARSEIENVFEQSPDVKPSGSLPPLPPMPDFSTLPELPPNPAGGRMDGFIPTPIPGSQVPPVKQAPAAEPVAPEPVAHEQPADQGGLQSPPPTNAHEQSEQERSLSERLGDILPPAQPQTQAPQPAPTQAQDPTQFQIPS